MVSTAPPPRPRRRARGFTLPELLAVMAAFGLLGLAAFLAKAQVGSLESYQRAQASVLLQDMQSRLLGNSADAASYVTASPLGTGDTGSADCAGVAAGSARDKCEWSQALKGAAEQRGQASVGALQDARGCIAQVQAENTAPGGTPGACGGNRSSPFVGGGLPPSPVLANGVPIDGKATTVVIGAVQKGSDGATGASVASGAQKIRPPVRSRRTRTYRAIPRATDPARGSAA
jgi:type IV pilus assembly protein PilV